MKQNTTEWHEARTGKLTASRWPAVLGLSPWSSREKLLRDMVREACGEANASGGNRATQWGHDHEQEAAEALEVEQGWLLTTCGIFVHPDHPEYAASPDRLLGQDALVEIKCPYSERIPQAPDPHYVAQVRWQLFVAGKGQGWIYYWTPSDSALFPVEPYSPEEMPEVLAVAKAFMRAYQDALADPAPYLAADRTQREDMPWQMAVRAWREAKEEVTRAQEIEQNMRDALIAMADGVNSTGYGVSVSFGKRKGSVDWQKLCKDQDITKLEQDKYRKPDTEMITVKEVKA